MSNGTVYFLPNTLIVNKGKLVSFVKRGEERTEPRQSSSVLFVSWAVGLASSDSLHAREWNVPKMNNILCVVRPSPSAGAVCQLPHDT